MENELILLVVGAIVGLVVGQGNELIRLRREERRAFGRALKTLISVRDYLYSVKKTKELMAEHFNLPTQHLIQFQYYLQAFVLPNPEELIDKYKEAIEIITGVKPLLGVSLAKQTNRLPMIMRQVQLMGQNEEASTLWLTLEKYIGDPSLLDNLILEVARLHSIETHDEVRGYLNDPVMLPPDLENLLKERGKAD